MFWYVFRHNVAETYIPNGGEEICSVAHGRRASSEQSKILCSRSSNFPCLSFEPGASGLTAGPFACYWQTSRRHGILSSCNYLIQTRSTRLAHCLGHVPAWHGVLRRGGSWTARGWHKAWCLGESLKLSKKCLNMCLKLSKKCLKISKLCLKIPTTKFRKFWLKTLKLEHILKMI